LARRDPSIDATAFAFFYTLLCQHPSIRICTYPLPAADGSVQLGTAPLPADYTPPLDADDVDVERMYREGKRGREVAFHLAGEEHKTSKGAVKEKKLEQEQARLERRQAQEHGPLSARTELEQVRGEDDAVLFTTLEGDDGELGGKPVERTDLAGLAEKWGNRLRIRCTDDEIYFRLTGSHQKVSS
jgi:hypothetical protein